MGALGQLFGRIRANPWLGIAVAAGALLVIAWIAWAAYVASDKGATEGLGVVIAWPLILLALILVALPFVGIYVLIRNLSSGTDAAGEQEGGNREMDADGDGDASRDDGAQVAETG